MSQTRKDDKGKKKGFLGVFGGKNKKDAAEVALPNENPAIIEFKGKFKQKVTSNLSAFDQFAELLKIYASFNVSASKELNERAQVVEDESCRKLIIPIVKAVTNCDSEDKSLPYFKEGLSDRLTGKNKLKYHTAIGDLFYQPEILKVINNGAFVKRQLYTEELTAFLSSIQQSESKRSLIDVAIRKGSQAKAAVLGGKQGEKIKDIETRIKKRDSESDFDMKKDSLSESDTTSSSYVTPETFEKVKVAIAKNSPTLERKESPASVYDTPQAYRTPTSTPSLSRASTEGSTYETPRGSMSLTQAELGIARPPLPTTPPPLKVEKKGPPPPADMPPPPSLVMPQSPSMVPNVGPAVSIPPPPPPPAPMRGALNKPVTTSQAKSVAPVASSPKDKPVAPVSGSMGSIAAQAAAARGGLRKTPVSTTRPIAEDTLQPLAPTSSSEVTVAIPRNEEKKNAVAKPEVATKKSVNKLVYDALLEAKKDSQGKEWNFFADYAMSLSNNSRLSEENFNALDDKQKTFLIGLHALAMNMSSRDDQQKFVPCAGHLNQLVLDVFNPDQSTEAKEKSLRQFLESSLSYVKNSYDVENEAARKRYNMITGIVTAAAVLIGAAVAIGVGITITLLTGGTLTVPYFLALSTQTVAIYGAASAAGVVGAGALTFGLFKKFQPADKQIDSKVQLAVEYVDNAAADLLNVKLMKKR